MSRRSRPSQSSAFACSIVLRTSPTLPPKPRSVSGMTSALPGALERDADIPKGCRNWRVRLVDRDPHGRHLREAFEHRVRNGAGSRLDQPVALCAKNLCRRIHNLIIADRMGELVGARRLAEVDVEDEIERERLANVGLMLQHAMIGMQRKSGDEDSVAHVLLFDAVRIALATRTAW